MLVDSLAGWLDLLLHEEYIYIFLISTLFIFFLAASFYLFSSIHLSILFRFSCSRFASNVIKQQYVSSNKRNKQCLSKTNTGFSFSFCHSTSSSISIARVFSFLNSRELAQTSAENSSPGKVRIFALIFVIIFGTKILFDPLLSLRFPPWLRIRSNHPSSYASKFSQVFIYRIRPS